MRPNSSKEAKDLALLLKSIKLITKFCNSKKIKFQNQILKAVCQIRYEILYEFYKEIRLTIYFWVIF